MNAPPSPVNLTCGSRIRARRRPSFLVDTQAVYQSSGHSALRDSSRQWRRVAIACRREVTPRMQRAAQREESIHGA